MGFIFTPGYYVKLRLDDEGNIIEAIDQLEESDLPSHTHSIQDLDEKELKDKISEVLETFFANNPNCAVKFDYDRNTQTISADVEVDGETIDKNEYGQLSVIGEGGSGNSYGGSERLIEELEDQVKLLKENIPSLVQEVLAKTFIDSKSPVVFDWDDLTKTYTADLKIDGLTIIQDENGNLVAQGGGGAVEPSCANHTHTPAQIEGFQDAVINIFNDYSQTINIQNQLETLVDGVTIKFNQYGQLVAVSTALQKHTHKIEEIIDYKPPEPAAKQPMSDLGTDVDYSAGVIDFSKLNIGYSILALSQYIGSVVNKNIENINKRIENLVTSSGTSSSGLSLSSNINNKKNTLYDRKEGTYTEVYYAPEMKLNFDNLPPAEGKLDLVINGKVVETVDTKDLKIVNSTSGSFKVVDKTLKNNVVSTNLEVDISKYLKGEGSANVQLKYQYGENTDYSPKFSFKYSDVKELPVAFTDTTSTHITKGGKLVYDEPPSYSYRLDLTGVTTSRFINTQSGFGSTTGALTGTASKPEEVVTVQNNFTTTQVPLKFTLTPEKSESELYKDCIELEKGDIISDVLQPGSSAIFELPGTSNHNAIFISGLEDYLDHLTAYKEGFEFDSKSDSPAIFMIGKQVVASLLEKYDPGKTDFKLKIELPEGKSLDLSKVKIESKDFI